MDETLAKALKKKKELQEQLRKLDAFIELHNDLFGVKSEGKESSQSEDDQEISRRRRGNPAAVADMAEEVIREAGRPLTRGELVDRIEARGVEINSDDKPRYIGTILWRQSERFENIEGRGYWVIGVERNPADMRADELFK